MNLERDILFTSSGIWGWVFGKGIERDNEEILVPDGICEIK